jgi:hypothetical protein
MPSRSSVSCAPPGSSHGIQNGHDAPRLATQDILFLAQGEPAPHSSAQPCPCAPESKQKHTARVQRLQAVFQLYERPEELQSVAQAWLSCCLGWGLEVIFVDSSTVSKGINRQAWLRLLACSNS